MAGYSSPAITRCHLGSTLPGVSVAMVDDWTTAAPGGARTGGGGQYSGRPKLLPPNAADGSRAIERVKKEVQVMKSAPGTSPQQGICLKPASSSSVNARS